MTENKGLPTWLLCPGACCTEGKGQQEANNCFALGLHSLSPSKLIHHFTLHVKRRLNKDLWENPAHSSAKARLAQPSAPQPFLYSGSERQHRDWHWKTGTLFPGKEFDFLKSKMIRCNPSFDDFSKACTENTGSEPAQQWDVLLSELSSLTFKGNYFAVVTVDLQTSYPNQPQKMVKNSF